MTSPDCNHFFLQIGSPWGPGLQCDFEGTPLSRALSCEFLLRLHPTAQEQERRPMGGLMQMWGWETADGHRGCGWVVESRLRGWWKGQQAKGWVEIGEGAEASGRGGRKTSRDPPTATSL